MTPVPVTSHHLWLLRRCESSNQIVEAVLGSAQCIGCLCVCVCACLPLTLHHPGHILANNGFSKDGPSKDVANGAIWRLPHLLQLEFCHRAASRGESGALYACVWMHVCLLVSPSTLFSSGVIVAHLIPTLYFAIASAHSTVTAPGQEEEGRGEGRWS